MWQQGSAPVSWGYTGEHWDANVGLLYLRARWYDPTVGRLTQADRIVPNPLNSQAWNRYAYGLNNPLRYTDPSGYCADNQDDPVCKHVPLLITYSLYYEILSYEVRVGEPGRQPINEELAATLNNLQAGLDTIGWAINLNRFLADSAVFLLVISSPPVAPAVAPVAVLSKIADEYDACTGWLGALMSSFADYYEGYTYSIGKFPKNPLTFTVVVGGDSAREMVANSLNDYFGVSLVDIIINTFEMLASWKGISTDPSHEVRLSLKEGIQVIEYVEKCKD
jgi:RHS repeat-associated protein